MAVGLDPAPYKPYQPYDPPKCPDKWPPIAWPDKKWRYPQFIAASVGYANTI